MVVNKYEVQYSYYKPDYGITYIFADTPIQAEEIAKRILATKLNPECKLTINRVDKTTNP